MKKLTSVYTCTATALALVLVVGAGQPAAAQFENPDGPGGSTPTPPTSVPLDGGASLLLAGGVAYGLRQLRQRRKQ